MDVGLSLIAAQATVDPPRQRIQYPGTVSSYVALTEEVLLNLDDGGSLAAQNTTGQTLVQGQRVMVAFERPHGVFVAAIIT
jgi:hypothetical protein